MPAAARGLDPRLRVLFLAGAAAGLLLVRDLRVVAACCAVAAVAWLIVGLPPRRLVRQVVKLWGFALLLAISCAIRDAPDSSLGFAFGFDPDALREGAVLYLRVLAVVIASQVARAGDPRAIAAGLGKLGIPETVSASIDTVLALLGDGGGGRGGGGGGGGGRGDGGGRGGRGDGGGRGGGGGGRGGGGRGDGGAGGGGAQDGPREGLWAALKRISGGDVDPIVRRLERQIERAGRHVDGARPDDQAPQGQSAEARARAHDVAVIAGVSLTMLGVKALKILPSIPFAPGYKIVLFTPLYIVARLLTHTPFGATIAGATMGTVAFLMGDGKYGIFEILKHIAPGIITDLVLPVLVLRGRRPGALGWSLFGGLIAAGRFATIFAVVFFVQAPRIAYAMLIPGLTVHMTFGILSGWVTHHLVRAVDRARSVPGRDTDQERQSDAPLPPPGPGPGGAGLSQSAAEGYKEVT